MPKPKKPITTKRGQFHKHRKFWFMLVSDVSLTKMDNITIKRNRENLYQLIFEFFNSFSVLVKEETIKLHYT